MTTVEPATEPTEKTDLFGEAKKLIDEVIPVFSGRTLVEAAEVVNLLLDVRITLDNIANDDA